MTVGNVINIEGIACCQQWKKFSAWTEIKIERFKIVCKGTQGTKRAQKYYGILFMQVLCGGHFYPNRRPTERLSQR